ncbi:MAG: hypothetical protein ACD_21C00042G0002 [uncultured bacterium]|nr:MAG: hypothetical protein ACD_21C00042G0002 [uncultured bacterium]KKQ80789.1 MAG: hypothetical protein UT02_C0002G0014 [Parcubacteria group bacterium GW2011_GWC2_38_7]
MDQVNNLNKRSDITISTFRTNMSNNIYNNLSEKELKYSYWYVTHRVFLRKLGILILAVAVGALLIYGVVLISGYYINDTGDTKALADRLSQDKFNLALLAESNKPKELVVGETQVLRGNKGNVDFVTKVLNPNVQWAVESIDYYYINGEEKTDIETSYVLPEQTKYLLHFNYPSISIGFSPRLVVEKVNWKKVVDFAAMQEKFVDFDVQNVTLTTLIKPTAIEPDSITNISFDVFNKSAYSFWEPRFIVLFERGGQLIAVAETQLSSLASNEKKTESLNLFQTLPAATTTTIIPDINILDPNVFKGFDVGSGELK